MCSLRGGIDRLERLAGAASAASVARKAATESPRLGTRHLDLGFVVSAQSRVSSEKYEPIDGGLRDKESIERIAVPQR